MRWLAVSLLLCAPALAANKTVTVKSSGGTYTTLAAAIAGELTANADLTGGGLDGVLTIECYALTGADTTKVDVNGFTTDASHYLRIIVPAAERHDGKRNTSKYRLECSAANSYALYIRDEYVRVEGLQVKATGATARAIGVNCNATSDVRIIDTLMYDSTQDGIFVYSGTATLNNCVAMSCGAIGINNYGDKMYANNCVSVNCNYGFDHSGTGGVTVLKNCYAGGNTTEDYRTKSGGTYTKTTCHAEDATGNTQTAFATDSGARFVNVTAGSEDVHLQAISALIDVGTDLGTDTYWVHPDGEVDFEGETRDTWDVGADEIEAPALLVVGTATAVATVLTPTGTNTPTVELDQPDPTGGTPPYTYQWYRDAEAIDGATTQDYDDTGCTPGTEHTYYCHVEDSAGTPQEDDTNEASATAEYAWVEVEGAAPSPANITGLDASTMYEAWVEYTDEAPETEYSNLEVWQTLSGGSPDPPASAIRLGDYGAIYLGTAGVVQLGG